MVNNTTSNDEHQQHLPEHLHPHQPHHHADAGGENGGEALNESSGILVSPHFINGSQSFEPIYQANVAEKHLKVAGVTLPNSNRRDFHIHKNSKGNILFDLVAESENLLEKDYFGLRYEDELGEMTWLYPDKRIQKQLKHKPWNFVFQIKFYPPEPSALADDLTRYLLYLQIRKEIYEGKLPASYAKQILLAAMVMQAEIGDYEAIKQSPHDYERFLRDQHLIPQINEEVLIKVREAHKEQKGLTPNEAHQKYLDTAKDLAKYGFTFYNAKDTKNGPVIIGIYAHGICVYKDQLQIHRFLWQGINKIQFRGSKFSVVLKSGELDPKKEVTVNYRLTDYATAKKCYRTAVEHHTFFRLIKPEDKPKGTFLRRWGSDRFRYQGRTYFQAKMASQMFDHPSNVSTVQRTPSGRQVSRSVDDLAQRQSFPTSPMHYADETTQQLTTPEKSKSYSLSLSKAEKAKKKAEELSPLTVVVPELQQQQQGQQQRSDSMSSGSSSPISVSMASPNSGEYYVRSRSNTPKQQMCSPYEEVIFPLSLSKEERERQYQTPTFSKSSTNRNSRVRFSSDTKQPVTPEDGSAVAMAPAIKPGKRKAKRRLFGPVNDDHTAFSPVDDLFKTPELASVPLDSRVTLYDKGWYATASTSSSSTHRALSPSGLFIGCCRPPRRTLVSERLLRNRDNLPSSSSSEYSIIKRPEIEAHPIRYFVEVYHSGRPQIETRRKQRRRFLPKKDADFVNPNDLNKEYYNFPKDVCYDWDRTECSRDPEGLPLKQFSTIYWFGGNSRQGNAKPVGIQGQNILVSSEPQKQGEEIRRMIITEASTSSQRQQTSEEPKIVEIIEEKPVIHVRQEEGKTITTIETTTIITSIEHEKVSEVSETEITKAENIIAQSSSPPESVMAEPTAAPPSEPIFAVETFSKNEELDSVPIKKYSNVYHSGTSIENQSPIDWVKKKKGILFIKSSSQPRKSQTSIIDEPQPSTSKEPKQMVLGKRKKSAEDEKIGAAKIVHQVSKRARTFSMSKHYPQISEPFEGEYSQIQRTSEAPTANLFDCVDFVDDGDAIEEPKTKKAKHGRAARFCLACVGGSRQRGITKQKSKESVVPVVEERDLAFAEEPYAYEPITVQEIQETVEAITQLEEKKPAEVPEVIITHDLSLIPAEEELQSFPQQSEIVKSDLSQHSEIISEQTSYENVEQESIIIETPSTPTPSVATNVEDIVHHESIQDTAPFKNLAISGYPCITATYTGEVEKLAKSSEVPHEHFVIEGPPRIEENLTAETIIKQTDSHVSSAFIEPVSIVEQKNLQPAISLSKRTKMLAEKKHYPLIGTSFTGEVSDLSRKQDIQERNLLDTISFQSGSDDSGLGEESDHKAAKKFGGLWCGPGFKKSKKASDKEEKRYNFGEMQTARNKNVKRARLFSFSKNYPEVGAGFEGEVSELKPVQQIQSANLFDEINFAPDVVEVEKVTVTEATTAEPKSKSSSLWCGPGTFKRRTTSITSTKSEESIKKGTLNKIQIARNKASERARTFSMSHHYPEIGASYEGEIAELKPVEQIQSANIFDEIDFASDAEIEVFTETQKQEEVQKLKKEKSTSTLWCGMKKQKTSEASSVSSISLKDHKNLNAMQIARNKNVKRARLFSFSKNYPEVGESYEGEVLELKPVQQIAHSNLFDQINFAPDIVEVKDITITEATNEPKSKSSSLWCGPGTSKKRTTSITSEESIKKGTLNKIQIARNKASERARTFSMSHHYPEVGASYEGEIVELKPVEQIHFANIFDEIDFASDAEKIEHVVKIEQQPKVKKSSNLWCGMKDKKRKTSLASSISSRSSASSISLKDHKNLNAMQIARNKLVRRARYFSTSKNYPQRETPYEGEISEMIPVQQAPFAKLFDEVSFAATEDEIPDSLSKRNGKKSKLNCLACHGFKSKSNEITEKAEDFAYEKAPSSPHEVELFEEQLVGGPEVLITEEDKIAYEEPTKEFIEEHVTRLPQEPKVVIIEEVNTTREFREEVQKESFSEEIVELALPLRNFNEAQECTETTIAVPPENARIETSFAEPEQIKIVEESKPSVSSVVESETIEQIQQAPQGYPPLSEPYLGEISPLAYNQQISESIYIQEKPSSEVIFESPNPNLVVIHHQEHQTSTANDEWVIGYPKSVEFNSQPEEELIHSEMALKSQTLPATSVSKETSKTSKSFSLPWVKKKKQHLKGYPLYSEAFEKDIVELTRSQEAPEKNLFDCISFISDSDDSGLGADSGINPKSKHRKLWCGPGLKKSKKLSAEEIDKQYNFGEIQTARNKKVKRARLFSFSKNYPEVGTSFEGEILELKPVQQLQHANLFDEIDFAPDVTKVENVTVIETTNEPKSKSSSSLWCGPGTSKKRTTSLTSEESIKKGTLNKIQIARNKASERARTFSMSHHYPEVGTSYEGEISELKPVQQLQTANIFDEIDFAPDAEKEIEVFTETHKQEEELKPKKDKSASALWCGMKKPKRKTSEASSVSSISLKDHKNLNAMQIARNKNVKRARLFSFSKNYPEVGESYEGEVLELKPVQQIAHSNLFDQINFAPDIVEVKDITVTETTEPKSKSLSLWCGPGTSKKRTTSVTSEESIKKGTLNKIQIARNKFVQKARTFSMSENYPGRESAFEGEIYELSPIPQIETANLFDCVSFDEEPPAVKFTLESLPSLAHEPVRERPNYLLACLTCGISQQFRNRHYPAIAEPYEGEVVQLHPRNEIPKKDLQEFVTVPAKMEEEELQIESDTSQLQQKERSHLITETHVEEFKTIYPEQDLDTSNLDNNVTIEYNSQQQNANLETVETIEWSNKGAIQAESEKILVQEEQINKIVEDSQTSSESYQQIPELVITEVSDLKPDNEIPQSEITEHVEFATVPSEGSHRRESQVITSKKHIIISDEAPDAISAKEFIEEPIVVHDLAPVQEIPSKNLFDTISFQSGSDDSGLGEESDQKAAKKFGGLWCGPGFKKSKKASEKEEKRYNFGEMQTARNKNVKRARLFSFSKNYPEVGVGFEGEIAELNPVQQIQSANLFDEINFAPDVVEVKKVTVTQTTKTEPKSKSSSLLWCGPGTSKRRTTSITSTKSEESIKKGTLNKIQIARNKASERARTFSMSHHYPEIGASYEGEIAELKPVQQLQSANLFDEVDFAPDTEKEIEVFAEAKSEELKPKKDKSASALWCGMKKPKRKTSEASSVSSISLKDHKNLNAMQIARNRIVRRARYFSTSKNYPEVGASYEGDIVELKPIKQLEHANLFDQIDFDPDVVEVKETTTVEPKSKSSSSLWCGPGTSKKRTTSVTSEESIKKGTLNKIQIARNKASERARTFSMSHHYPEIGTSFEGEVSDLKPVKQIQSANIFDEIDFAPEEIETKKVIKVSEKTPKASGLGLNFLWCGGPKRLDYSKYPSDSKPYTGELKELKVIEEAPSANLFDCVSFASVDDVNQDLLLNGHVVSQPNIFEHQQPIIIEQESVEIPYGYPLPEEPYEGEIETLHLKKDYEYLNIYDHINDVPKGISYVPPPRKPSFLERIRRSSFRETRENSFEGEVIREEVQNVHKAQHLEIPSSPIQQFEIVEKTDVSEKSPMNEEVVIVEEVSEAIIPEQTFTTTIELTKQHDISYHNETTIAPNVFITETVKSELIPATVEELKGYPIISEPFNGELDVLERRQEAPSSSLFDEINFLVIDKKVEEIKPKKARTSSKFLWCGARSASPEMSETAKPKTFRSRIRTISMSKHYPEIAAPYEGELVELKPTNEAPSKNLFDEISFDSGESPTVEDISAQNMKKTKRALWCGPGTSKKRTTSIESEKSIKKGTLNKIQIARNKASERARTFSMSHHYPEIGIEHQGKVTELKPVQQLQSANLFDEIDFAPDTEKEIEVFTEAKSEVQIPEKEKSASALWCGMKKPKRKTSENSSVSSISLKDHKNLNAMQIARNRIVRRARYFSTSKHYPEIGTSYEGEIVDMEPVQQIAHTNLFDVIDFAPDAEVEKVTVTETTTAVEPKSKSSSSLWCGPGTSKKRTTSVTSEKSIKKGTLNKIQIARNKASERARTFSMSHHYPEVGTSYEGEVSELKPVEQLQFANIFDEIDFAPDAEKEIEVFTEAKPEELKPKKEKSASTLLCGMKKPKRKSSEASSVSSISLKDHKNLNAMQIARNRIVRRARYFSTSKNYPETGKSYEGDIVELKPVQQIAHTNLFDQIDFAPEEEETIEQLTSKLAKPSTGGSKLWCGKKPKTSSVSGSSRGSSVSSLSLKDHKNLNALQIARNKLVQRSRYFSTSKHYPEIGEVHECEIFDLNPTSQILHSNLFDEITFAPEVEEAKIEEVKATKEKQPSRNLVGCLTCTGRKTPKTVIEEPYEVESRETSNALDIPSIVLENASTISVIDKDLAMHTSSAESSIQHGYPLITEPYNGEITDLNLVPEIEYSELPKIEITTPDVEVEPLLEESADNYETHVTVVSESENQEWISGMPEVIQSEHHEIITTTRHVTSETIVTEFPDETTEKYLVEEPSISVPKEQFERFEEQPIESTVTITEISNVPIEEELQVTSSKYESPFQTPLQSPAIRQTEHVEISPLAISKRTKMFAEKKHYPLVGTSFTGEVSDLSRKQDIQERNLLDTISFQSGSDDSGLGKESDHKASKKFGGLWCGPGFKKSKKASEKEEKRYNFGEMQTARNKNVKRARLFSFSKNYPEVGAGFEGEIAELKPVQQIQSANLFDEINFAPDVVEVEKVTVTQTTTAEPKSKTSSLWCGPGTSMRRTTSVTSTKSEESIKKGTLNKIQITRNKASERARTFSMSHHYPEIGTSYEGEIVDMKPVQQIQSANLFDEIDFAPEAEKENEVFIEAEPEELKPKKDKSTSALWCGMKRRKTSEASSVSSISLKDHKNLNAMQIARNKIVRRPRYFSTSKNYPEVGASYEGDVFEMKPVQQIAHTNLFDQIDFAPEVVEVEKVTVTQTTTAESKSKSSSSLWCGPGTSKKRTTSVTSEESIKKGTLNKIQIARNKASERARTFSMSHHYPEVGTSYEGEIVDMKPVQQIQSANIFDEVDFAPDAVDAKNVKVKEFKKRENRRGGTLVLCAPFRASSKNYPALEEPYTGIIHDSSPIPEVPSEDLFKCVDFQSSSEQGDEIPNRLPSEERQPKKQMATLYFRRNTKQYGTNEGYPALTEPFKGEIIELKRHLDAEAVNLFDCVSFASESDDEIPISQSSNAKDTSKKGTPDKPRRKLRLFGKTRRSTSEKELDLTVYPGTEAFEGPYIEAKKSSELEREKLRQFVTIYHSGYSQPIFRHKFLREKHERVDEFGEAPQDYSILHFTAEETIPLRPAQELEAQPLRSYAKYPVVSISESPRDMKRKYSKSKIIPESSSESSSQSESENDAVPSLKPPKKKEGEGFLSFFRNRLSAKQQQQRKRTGYEGLVEKYAGSYEAPPRRGYEISDQPILEHVHVYHNGTSAQQPIDSGFEDGANASETEKAGTFKRTAGKLFFDKFKLSKDSGDKTTTEEIEPTETKKIVTKYETLNTEPFLGLHSSTVYANEVEHYPLTSAIDNLPPVYFYEGDATHSPIPIESKDETTLERAKKAKKPKKDSHFAYGFLTMEGPISETEKISEIGDLPIGEHVTVYHCGRSDVPTVEVPPEVYEYQKEEISEGMPPQLTHLAHQKSSKRDSLKSYPEPFTYEGPIETLERIPEAGNRNLQEHVKTYHSGFYTSKKNAPHAKTSQEETQKRQYSLDTTPFEGEIGETKVQREMESLPSEGGHALPYHPGKSEVQDLEDLEEREIQKRELSLIQRIMAMFRKRELQGYPSSSEEYNGPMEETSPATDVPKTEIKTIANVYHSGYSFDPKTSKLTFQKRFGPRRKVRVNLNDYPKNIAPMDAVVYDLHATEDVPKTPSPVTLPPESLIYQSPPKQASQPSKWYRFWFLRRRGEVSSPESSMPIIVESMSHRITDTSGSIFMATTDRSLFAKGHWPVTDIDVDVMLKTITKVSCECEALIIEKHFVDGGIGGGKPLLLEKEGGDNNCFIGQTSHGKWNAKITMTTFSSSSSPQMTDNNQKSFPPSSTVVTIEKAEHKSKEEEDDEVDAQKNFEDEEEIEVSRNYPSSFLHFPESEPSYIWSKETFEELVDNEDDDLNNISTEYGELPLTHTIESSTSVCDSEMFASIRRRLSEKLAKKEKKKEEKLRKKEEKERKKHASKSGVSGGGGHASGGRYSSESSSSSAASVSDAEIEERHVVISKAIEGPVQSLMRNQELGDLDNIEEDNNNKKLIKMAPQTAAAGPSTAAVNNIESNSSGPYTPAKERDGRIIREETVEQVYRISGTGHAPVLDPNDMSLQSTVDKCVRDTDRMPRVQMVEANILVKECEPLPQAILEGSAPHTTVHTWNETETGPETITTEVDEHGNKITRTIKTQTTKHTIQKQTYQTYAVDDETKDEPESTITHTKESTIPLGNKSAVRSPVVHTKTRTVAYEKGSEAHENHDPIGELVSTKTITTGNRTVEILTYKTEKDGVIETRVEHRVTIHSGDNIDHDAELAKALLEATEMSPDLIINRVEVEKQTQR